MSTSSDLDTLEACLLADAADPLAGVGRRFSIPDGLIYLDGNSLGPMPHRAVEAIAEAATVEWGEQLIGSWTEAGWFDAPLRLGRKLESILGVEPQNSAEPSLVVCDTISINLFKLVSALSPLDPDRPNVLVEHGAFPTDRYVVGGAVGEDHLVDLHHPEDLARAVTDDVGLVVLSHVDYRTGCRWDMEAATRTVHEAGALVVWDLAHSAGSMDLHLSEYGVDAAVGCTYKYLNGGPGSQGFLYLRPGLADRVSQPIAGWWGHAAPFAMEASYRPAGGVKRFMTGTQAILTMSGLEAALDELADVDWAQVRAKSERLSRLFIDRMDAIEGVEVSGPRDPDRRGSHVSVRYANAYPLVRALIDRGVIGDFREPDFARFGLVPLILSYADVWRAADQIADVIATGAWDRPEYHQRLAVT